MIKSNALLAAFFLFSVPQFCHAQEYFGSWTLDWSRLLSSTEHVGSHISDSLEDINYESRRNPIWVFSMDSLKVYQNETLISVAEIKWKKNDQFEIIDSSKKKNPEHYIDHLEDGRIKMRTSYSDAEIYLRKL